ncbi:MAG: protein-disulfide reductase DsbD domain-containing protein [Ferruginibacter sp.]
MKQFFFFAILSSFFLSANAQIENPVKWSYTAKKISDKMYELHITATLDNKWHIYSQDAGEGPEPTSFSFDKNPLLKLDGKVIEKGKLEKEYDNNFKSELRFFSNTVDFVQKVKLKSTAATAIKGTITYMTCNDKKCLPPKEVPFTIKLSGK